VVADGAVAGAAGRGTGRRPARGAALVLAAALLAGPLAARAAGGAAPPDVLLVTLDTTRADALGAWGGGAATPHLDALARRGVRYASAWSAAPTTLPAHASLLSGRTPGEHGLRENGLSPLAPGVALLAERFARAGYRTAAVVGSRILDRRFGLDRGFAVYDDRMAAERVGEFGYPEREAAAVVDAALRWLAAEGASGPRLLWVHFYDPHRPYRDHGLGAEAAERLRYAAEVAAVDRELGRLLAALPAPERWLVAVAGDHGEAFGEHGEREHGLLLHRTTLEVPLLLAGPGVAAGRTVATPVGTARLAATLLERAGLTAGAIPGPPLPDADETAEAVLSETFYPASVYGWSPLVAVTRGPLRLVLGPTARLYDLARDPGEERDVLAERAAEGRDLLRLARSYRERRPFATLSPEADAATRALLGSLGYLSGATGRAGELDPAEGVPLVARFDEATRREAAGDREGAAAILRELVAASPGSVPFLARAAGLEAAAGRLERAEALLRRAIELQPGSEFLRSQLGELLLASGREAAGEAELRAALERNPVFAPAWLALAESAARSGRAGEEAALLERAVAAGTESAALRARRAELALAAGRLADAETEILAATELLPDWAAAWLVAGEVAERRGDAATARERYLRAAGLGGAAAEEARRRLARAR
jgi:arylsulfatase A-like enzyme/Tfp pilus assembly protein PilF